MTLILGIDDAARGPLIGPMILAGVLVNKEQEKILSQEKITDSKLLYQNQRIRLAKTIKANSLAHKIITTSASEIDNSINSGTNLNKLEAIEAAKIINFLNSGKNMKERITVIIDCPSVNLLAWKRTLTEFLAHPANLTIKCEHKADLNHKIVSAASILAKVKREEEVKKLKEKFGNFGSGYPSDPNTRTFLREHGNEFKDSGLFRKTWSTWKKVYPDKEQTKLFEFR